MSLITSIQKCRQGMSPEGWTLFCAHRRADTLSPFDPETAAPDEEVFLSNLERLQYCYRSPPPVQVSPAAQRLVSVLNAAVEQFCAEITRLDIQSAGDASDLADRLLAAAPLDPNSPTYDCIAAALKAIVSRNFLDQPTQQARA